MRGEPYVFSGFASGIDKEAAPYSIAADRARDALNIISNPIGCIRKRNGCPTLAAPAAVATSLLPFEGGTDALVVAHGTKLQKCTTAGTLSDLKTGLTAGTKWSAVQAATQTSQGPMFLMNGTDTPQYWDGSAGSTSNWTANSGTLPNGKYMAYHENRVYVAGVSGNPSTLYWSDIILPRNWASPDGGATKLDPEDGLSITGMGKVGPYLLIFKESKTFLLLDSNTGGYRRISDDMGCIAQRSIVKTELGTFFVTPEKELIVTDGNTFNRDIGIPIRQILQSVPGNQITNVAGVHLDKSYYLAISVNGTVNDTILEYDFITGSWWIHSIYLTTTSSTGINQFAILNVSGDEKLYGAGADTGTPLIFECFKKDTYTDSTDIPYLTQWIGPWHTFEQPHIRKIVREMRVDALGDFDTYTAKSFATGFEASELQIWEIAESAGTTFGGSGTFGGGGTFGDTLAGITERRYHTLGAGRAWSVKFSSQTKQDLQIYAYTMGIEFRRD